MLSSDQIEHYRNEGYLVLPNFVEAAEVDALRAEVDRLLGAAPTQPGARRNAQGNPVDFPGDFAFTNLDDGNYALNRLSQPLWHSQVVLRTYGHPKLLAAATSLYGAELVPFAESIVVKLPRTGSPFAWHQDGSFKSGAVPERGVN